MKKVIFTVARFLSEIFPCLVLAYVWDCNRKIEEKEKFFKAIAENDENYLNEHKDEKEKFMVKTDLSLSNIEECHKKEIERKKTLEDKAKSNLLAITISISLMLGILGLALKDKTVLVAGNSCFLVKIIMIIFSCGVLYFLYGGWAALRAIRTDKFGELYINDEVRINKKEVKREDELIKCIELNTLVTRKRSNYIDSSYIGIRNGIICLGACFIIVMCVVLYNLIKG